MQFGRSSRKSIRYSIFIGVLAGSVFSGSGAFAVDTLTQETFYSTINGPGGLAGSYVLGEDIDISTADGGLAPAGATVFGTFTGTLDGADWTISGLTKPLFDQLGTISDGASVTDLVLAATGTEFAGQGILANGSTEAVIDSVSASATGVITSNTNYTGGLVGSAMDTQINNSSFSGTISSSQNYVGGLVGTAVDTQIDNSSFAGVISGFQSVGGLVGYTNCSDGACDLGSSTITNSQATGEVTGYSAVGGLVGAGYGEINNSHADVTIVGTAELGGLIGWSETSIDQSYSSGSVSSVSPIGYGVGGISGAQGNFTISNSYSTAVVTGASDVGGLAGYTYGDISNSYSYVTGDITGTGSNVGGLVGGVYQNNLISNSYSYVTGDITGAVHQVGGLVGYTAGSISNSYSDVSGNITGTGVSVGGLVGYTDGDVTNSYSLIGGNVSGLGAIGGLVGSSDQNITNSNSYITGNVEGTGTPFEDAWTYVGGLVGYIWKTITDSYSYVGGDVTGEGQRVGGMAGYSRQNIEDSYSYVGGNVSGYGAVGGMVGYIEDGDDYDGLISGSHSFVTGNVTGTYWYVGGMAGFELADISNSYSEVGGSISGENHVFYLAGNVGGSISGTYASVTGDVYLYDSAAEDFDTSSDFNIPAMPIFPTILETINPDSDADTFAQSGSCNDGNPYLVSLIDSYGSCNGGGGTPPPTRRDRIEREFREVLETRTPEKIEKLDGFKKEAQLVKDAAITFVEPTEKIELTKVKAVEIAATANVRVNAKADEALQISLKSESKEPVELWVKSPDGKWLLAGVITFDKDGKAILPPLKFKNVGNYSLVLSKPTAESAKGSAPLNQTGSLLVAVS